MTEKWEPKIAAERLAEYMVDVLDYVGRVDQGVSSADLFYVLDKAGALVRAAERLRDLASELVDEDASLYPYVPRIEAALVRAGRSGYRVAQKLHPDVVTA